MSGKGRRQFGAVVANLTPQDLLKVAILLNQALHALLESAIIGVEVFFEGRGEIRVDFIAGAIQGGLQVFQQLLAFPPDRISINLSTSVLQRKNANPQGCKSILISLPAVASLEQLCDGLAVGDNQCQRN